MTNLAFSAPRRAVQGFVALPGQASTPALANTSERHSTLLTAKVRKADH